MSNLLRRLRKLEARLIDFNGLVPHSKEWFEYWEAKVGHGGQTEPTDISAYRDIEDDNIVARVNRAIPRRISLGAVNAGDSLDAKENGIRIGIHPDDPPVPELAGVPRSIFGNYDCYVRALEIANSPNCRRPPLLRDLGGRRHGQAHSPGLKIKKEQNVVRGQTLLR